MNDMSITVIYHTMSLTVLYKHKFDKTLKLVQNHFNHENWKYKKSKLKGLVTGYM